MVDEADSSRRNRGAKEYNNSFLSCLKLHISHGIGGSALLLPFAISQVGVPLFSLFLAIHACFNGYFHLIILKMAQVTSKEEKGEGERKDFVFGPVVKTSCWVTSIVKFYFLLDVSFCTAFYFLLFEDIFINLLLPEANSPQEIWGVKMLTSVVISLLMFIGISMYDQDTSGDHEEEAESNDNTDNNDDIPNGNKVRFMECFIGKMYVSVQGPGDAYKPANNFRWESNIQLTAFMLLFAMVISDFIEKWKYGFINPMETDLSYYIDQIRRVGFHQIICANAVIMFCFKSYSVIIPVNEKEGKVPPNQIHRLVFLHQLVLFVIYFSFGLFGQLGINGDVDIIFLTGYGFNLAGYVLNFLGLCFILSAMFLRFTLCFRQNQILISGRGDGKEKDVFWLLASFSIFVPLLIKSLFPDILLIALFTGFVASNGLRNISPLIAYFCCNVKKSIFEKLQAFVYFIIHLFLIVFGATFTAGFSIVPYDFL